MSFATVRNIGRSTQADRPSIRSSAHRATPTSAAKTWMKERTVRIPGDNSLSGEMAEWSMAVVLKTTELVRVPGVRIPLSPPVSARVSRPRGRIE